MLYCNEKVRQFDKDVVPEVRPWYCKKIFKLVLFKDVQNERLFFYPILKGIELMKTGNQKSKGRSPPFKTTKQIRFIQL